MAKQGIVNQIRGWHKGEEIVGIARLLGPTCLRSLEGAERELWRRRGCGNTKIPRMAKGKEEGRGIKEEIEREEEKETVEMEETKKKEDGKEMKEMEWGKD